jgi:hypothetical protein
MKIGRSWMSCAHRGIDPTAVCGDDCLVRDEVCAACGEPTNVGTARYSGRRTIDGQHGARSFLCAECSARVHAARRGKSLSDAELRSLIDNGSMAAAAWSSGGS